MAARNPCGPNHKALPEPGRNDMAGHNRLECRSLTGKKGEAYRPLKSGNTLSSEKLSLCV